MSETAELSVEKTEVKKEREPLFSKKTNLLVSLFTIMKLKQLPQNYKFYPAQFLGLLHSIFGPKHPVHQFL